MVGQGLDRLMAGRMGLWEYGAVVHGWKERQPKQEGDLGDLGPTPTEDEWDRVRAATRKITEQVDARRSR